MRKTTLTPLEVVAFRTALRLLQLVVYQMKVLKTQESLRALFLGDLRQDLRVGVVPQVMSVMLLLKVEVRSLLARLWGQKAG